MRVTNYLRYAAVFVAFISLVYVSANGNPIQDDSKETKVPKVFDYGVYVEKFKKSYGPLETLHRAKLFFGRTMKIFQHNILYARKKVTHFLTQNIFTDMTASEFRKIYSNKEPELAPVKEALTNPDLPADSLASVRRLKGKSDEGFSQASLDDFDKNAKFGAQKQKVKPILTFMDNQNIDDMKNVLQQIKEMPDVDMTRVEELIDLKSEGLKQIESWEEHEGVANQYNKEQIKYKPIVKSNNNKYEPQVSTSFGAHVEQPKSGVNYAKFLMGDPDFEFNIAPYPYPDVMSKQGDDVETSEKDANIMSKFFGSVKSVANYLFSADDLYDDFEETGEKKEEEDKQEISPVKSVTPPVELIKYNIDWRLTGCVSPIQDQKMNCDSCYAFSVLSLMEYFHCRQTKQLTSFSAQYIIDCGSKVNLNGCRSSKVSNVGYFIKKYGIELSAKYPYNAQENTCPYNFDDAADEQKSGYLKPRISHWQNFPDMAAWYKWLPKSPLIVGINMPGDFLGYGGGVHDGLDCVNDMTHAMLLVGSGLQDGKEFWLLKNSFSESWGEEGYFKLAKSAPLRCFNSAIVARAKFLR